MLPTIIYGFSGSEMMGQLTSRERVGWSEDFLKPAEK
jgi:hypothetical protein